MDGGEGGRPARTRSSRAACSQNPSRALEKTKVHSALLGFHRKECHQTNANDLLQQ